jgi:hypothetical protein
VRAGSQKAVLVIVAGLAASACANHSEIPSPLVAAAEIRHGHARLLLADGTACRAPFPAPNQITAAGEVQGCVWRLHYAYAPREVPPLAALAADMQRATAGAVHNLLPFGASPERPRPFTLRVRHADGWEQHAPLWQGNLTGAPVFFSPPSPVR